MYQVKDHSLDNATNNHMQENDEEEIVEKAVKSRQRSATERVLTGHDCEYIKLNAVTSNDGCTDGDCRYLAEDATDNADNLREQVCDTAGEGGKEAVPHPEWPGHSWVCEEREEVC
jgi:hypothetical protein